MRGCRLRYLVCGEAEPLVLVHGLGGGRLELAGPPRRCWCPGGGCSSPSCPATAARRLCPRRRTSTSSRTGSRSWPLMRGLCSAPIVGHSLGGAIALRLAIRRPNSASRLCSRLRPDLVRHSQRGLRAHDHRDPEARPADRAAPGGWSPARPSWKTLVSGALGRGRPAGRFRRTSWTLPGPPVTPTVSVAKALVRDDRSRPRPRALPVACALGARDNQLPR